MTRTITPTPQAAPAASPRATGSRLGYTFDPVPRALTDAIHAQAARPVPPREPDPEKERARRRMLNDRLQLLDADVMTVLLRFRLRIRHSCWCTNEVIAREVGRELRSVQSSIRRLDLHGFIKRI